MTCAREGGKMGKIASRVRTASEMTAHNTFDRPNTVQPDKFSGFKPSEGGFTVELPAKSVVVLEME